MELDTVIDRWHDQQKVQAHYSRHMLAVAGAAVVGAGVIWAGHPWWGAVLIIVAATFGFIQHALVDVLVHHTYPVPDELLLLIADEPTLSDSFKRQLANALDTESVITFGELRELAWCVQRDEVKASARRQDGFRKLTDRYPVSTVESAH